MGLAELLDSWKNRVVFKDFFVDFLRYLRSSEAADEALSALQEALRGDDDLRLRVGGVFFEWLGSASLYSGFVQCGIYSRHGFFRELKARVYDFLNPPPRDFSDLSALLSFLRASDASWLSEISPLRWLRFYRELENDLAERALIHACFEVRRSVEKLSFWLAAEDLDPDLIHLDPNLLAHDSSFVALHYEVSRFLEGWQNSYDADEDKGQDLSAVEVMIEQCQTQIMRLERLSVRRGISVGTGHLLKRLAQTLERLHLLLLILSAESAEKRVRAVLVQLEQMVRSSMEARGIRRFVRNSASILSRSISANKSAHGEHYIAESYAQWRRLFCSAAGAGVVIALMALLKIKILETAIVPFWQAVLVCLDYGLGFVLIHILGFTVATKQPAMTAARIAQVLDEGQAKRHLERELAGLFVVVNRSQCGAVLGNVLVAMSVAALLVFGFAYFFDVVLLNEDGVAHQLEALHFWPSLLFASIAAVWLFCSGIISGYYDNRADYLRLRERLYAHPLLAFLGEKWRMRFANYMHDNFGALHGNFIFGVLLGATPFIGKLLHLPIDIRHIAFSSANLSYALASGGVSFYVGLMAFLTVLAIGLVNLWLSFFLAFRVALLARGVRVHSVRRLFKALWRLILERPSALFLPKRDD